MSWIWLTFYLAVILVFGMAGIVYFTGNERHSLSQKLGLLPIVGAGCLGYALFVFALLGVRPGRWPLVVFFLVAMAVVGARLIRKEKITLRGPRLTPLESGWDRVIIGILLVLLIVFQSIVLIDALAFPLYDWDAFAIWGMKSKVIAANGLMPRPAYFTDVSLSYSHLDYPLMVPFLMAGVYGVLGHVDDQMAKLALPLFYFAIACLVFAFGKRRLTTSMSCAVTVIVMGAPVMLFWAGSGRADVPMTAFSIAAVVSLTEWGEDLKWRSCLLCAILSAFAAFTKNEGLVLGIINGVLMLLLAIRSTHWKRRLVGAGLYAIVFLLLILPWIVWLQGIPQTHENYLAHLRLSEIARNASRVPIIIKEFALQLVSLNRYGLLWVALIASVMVGGRAFHDRTTVMLWLLLLLQVSIYALTFLVTPWDVRVHLGSALDRLILHVVPLGGLLLIQHLSVVQPVSLKSYSS